MTSLHAMLRSYRTTAGIPQKDVAAALGVRVERLGTWELGKNSPPVGSLVGWAGFFGRRPVVVHHRTRKILGDLVEVVEDLPSVRVSSHVTQRALADHLGISHASVGQMERTAGPQTLLSSVQLYLGSFGYLVGLTREGQ